MMVMHVQKQPEPPSSRTEQDIPPELERILLSCLAKDPNDRPPTADNLTEQLTQCGVGTTWTQEQAHLWWEAHLPDR